MKTFKFSGLFLLVFLFLSQIVRGQTVIIPRDGFPYCEPFTNSSTRANTEFGGNPRPAFLTAGNVDVEGDGFLQLTDNTTDQRGYVFIDLPFSSAYGIKVSFEYFAYGGINPPAYADGISFFMFDGDIGPSNFQIGGLGGSLGYSPWRRNANLTTVPDQPGLKGGYIGIGFDAFRNWGNEYEGRFGGFKDANATGFGPVPDTRQYYNSIAIRGPQSSNYQFIDGRRTYSRSFLTEEQPLIYTDPINSSYYLFDALPPLEFLDRRFKIGSLNKAELCTQDGYRKVFIDLAPVGGGNYLVTVDMLVNNGGTLRLENIFNKVPYNFPAPKNLKIGFAASTGTPNTNFHQIRNVTAEVSDYANIPLPEIEDLEAVVCEGDSNLFEFDVKMTSLNSFLRCVQLFETDPGAPDNTPPVGGNPSLSNCGLSNVCIEKCDPTKSTLYLPGKGTFYVELEQLTTDNFEDEKYAASIRFVPDPGFVGTAEAYYQVLDNYGILSYAKTITVTSNPDPIFVSKEVIENPSCDGQSDGAIKDLVIGDLVAGFDYEWFYEGNSIGKTNSTVSALSGGQASFELNQINLGTYTLSVWNPADNGRCQFSYDVEVTQEDGTPVDIEVNDQVLCEGNDVSINPIIPPQYGDDSGAKFHWYLSPDRSGGAISNGETRVIDGASVTFTISNSREITVSGLVSDGGSPKDYVFYVEAQSTSNPSGDFCPYLGDVKGEARVKVFPEIDFSASKTADDWCLDNTGSIVASVNNPSGAITYHLTDGNGNELASNGTGSFNGLAKGDYEVYATSSSPVCSSVAIPLTIEGPTEPFQLTFNSSQNEYCNLANGNISFTLLGGNVPYTITANGQPLSGETISGNVYTLPGLAAGSYQISVVDSKGCTVSFTESVIGEALPEFAVEGDQICEGKTATVIPKIINQSTSTPTFNWFASNGAGGYVAITTSSTFDGGTFSFDATTKAMSVSGLAASATPYVYYLQVTGDKVCDTSYMPVEILVNSGPEMSPPVLEMVDCFGAANGTIQAVIPSGSLSDYQFALAGDNGFNAGFSSNNGLFENLAPGTYTLSIQDVNGCSSSISDLVITEPSELKLQPDSMTEPTCGLDNGAWTFSVSGGTPDASGEYSLTLDGQPIASLGGDVVENSPGNFTISKLNPGNHTLIAVDSNGCTVEISQTFTALPIPDFGTQNVSICEGENATLVPQIIDQAGSTPVFTWSYEDASNPGTYIPIVSGGQLNGLTFTISNSELTVSGLTYQTDAYVFYLSVSGDKVCPEEPIPAEIQVLKIPEAVFEPIAVSCFQGSDGQITLVSSDPATNMTYTILETGTSNATGNFSGLSAGTYTIQVQEQGAPCNNTFEVVVTQPEELLLINDKFVNPTCGEDNGSISFELTGGTPAYTVEINGTPIESLNSNQTGQVFEVKGLAPGTYTVSTTDANGCVLTRTDLFVLTNDQGIDVTIDPMEDEVCVGLEAVIVPAFQTAPPVAPQMLWYKDAGLSSPLVSSANPDAEGITYTINSSTGQLTIEGLAEGNYSYYLEISGAGICTSVNEAKVTVNPAIVSQITLTHETCFGAADGTITVESAGGNGVFEYQLNTAGFGASNSFTDLAPGSYTVTVRNPLGCEEVQTVEILGPDSAIQINTPDVIRSSCDLPNGSIENLVISGGWGNYTVEWRKDSPTGTIIPGSATGASDLGPGLYYLLVKDEVGCQAEYSFTLEESSDPEYAVVPPINSCTGETVEIRPIHIAPDPSLPPAAATEVRWYKGAGQVGLIQNGPDASNSSITYTIDDSDWLNPKLFIDGLPAGDYEYYFYVVCTGQEIKVEVSVFDTPNVNFDFTGIACFGDTNGKVKVVSGALPSYSYTLNGGAPMTQAALEALNLGAGDYVLVVSTPAGCASTTPFTLYNPPSALASTPLTKIDPGCGALNGKLELTITGGWLPYTLQVVKDGTVLSTQTTSDSKITLNGYSVGTYSVNITDAGGCTLSTNTVTLVDGPTQILLDNQEICVGSTATLVPTLDPVAPGATYEWYFDAALTKPIVSSNSPAADGNIYQINAGNGTLTISNLAAQAAPYSYYVIASGSDICPGFVGKGEVRVYGAPTATATVENEVCFGDGGKITINASGGSGKYTYSLNGGAFADANVFEVTPGSYQVEIQTPEGCSYLLSPIVVTGPSAPLAAANIQQDNPTCDQDNGEIRFDISGGYEPYVVSYSLNGNPSGTINVATAGQVKISGLGIGDYKFEVKDAQGCIVPLPNGLTLVETATVITAEDDNVCVGENAVLTPVLPQNITNPVYKWSLDQAGNSPISNGTVNGVTYSIAGNGVLTISGLTTPGASFTYYVTASGNGICNISPEEVKVNVFSVPTLKVSNPSVVCDPMGNVDLTDYIEGFNPSVYDYNVLSPTGTAMQIDDLDDVAVSGDYRVSSSVKGSGCWNQPQRIRVLIADQLLVANFEFEVDLGDGTLVTNGEAQIDEDVQFHDLSQGNAIMWNWDFGDGNTSTSQNPIHQYGEKGSYTVTLQVIDSIGCISTFEMVVQVFDDYLVMIPNAFTPDGVKNITFRPYYRGISKMEFYIFNTWGELIYKADALEDQGWNGTLNGKPVPNGNYVYRGKFTSRSGETFERAGTFVLIR